MTSTHRQSSRAHRTPAAHAAIPLLGALLLSACAETGDEPVAPIAIASVPATEPALTAACERALSVLERCAQRIESQRPDDAQKLRQYEQDLRLRLSQLRTTTPDEIEHGCLQLAADGRALARQLPECGAAEISGPDAGP